MIKRFSFFWTGISVLTLAGAGCRKDTAAAPSMVEGLTAHPGKYRAAVQFNAPVGAVSGKVFFNSGDYKEFTVTTTEQQIIVEGLSEGEQILRVVTKNAAGDVSDPKAVKVQAYGDKYQNQLKSRRWRDETFSSPTEVTFLFEAAAAGETGVQVVYMHTSGKKDSTLIDSKLTSVTLKDIDTSKPHYYYSLYKPSPDAIDTFRSGAADVSSMTKLVFNKEKWTIAGFSDEAAAGDAALLIDNDINTFWQSKPAAQSAATHSVTVDMGVGKLVDGFYFVNAQNNMKTAQTVRIDMSDDNQHWTKILEAPVSETYLRQQLPLEATVLARYFKITAAGAADPDAPGIQFAEIDAYNSQGNSGDNGKEAWATSATVPLVNATQPFVGDGSNPFPTLGDKRLQRLKDWKHSTSAIVSFDSNGNTFSVFSAAVWGLPNVVNGKVWQTVNLQPGIYQLIIDVAGKSGSVDIYGVVADNALLPDYTAVAKAPAIIRYASLADNLNKKVNLQFVVPAAMPVTLGIVYNTYDQYSINGTPWTTFQINGFSLAKVN